MPFYLDCSRTYKNMLVPTYRETWTLQLRWPSILWYTVEVTEPRLEEKDPKSLKARKRVVWRKSKGVYLRGPSRWSKWLKNSNKRRARVVQVLVGKRPNGEDGNKFNATIVAETTSCGIVRSGRKSKRKSIVPQESESPPPFVHTDRSLGWNP